MNDAFANPSVLKLLAVAALPLTLYLLFRWRRRRVPWGAMRFLLRARRRVRRRVEIHHLVLLAVRTAFLLAVVLAFARPALRGGLAGLGQRSRCVVILLDSSYSMSAKVGDRTRHQRAADAVGELLGQLGEGERVSLVSFAGEARTVAADLPDPAAARRALAAVSPTSEATDLAGGLEAAAELLEAAKARDKVLVLVTDCQRDAWISRRGEDQRLRDALARVSKAADCVLLDVGDDGAANLAVSDLVAEDAVVGRSVPTQLRVSISNFSPSDRDVPVELAVTPPGEVAHPPSGVTAGRTQPGAAVPQQLPVAAPQTFSRTVAVAAGRSADVAFPVTFAAAGWQTVAARIGPDDLADDNVRHLAVEVRDELKVLLVDGRPGRQLYAGQVDFLVTALSPQFAGGGRPAVSMARPRVVTAADLETEQFAAADLVVLADVPSLSAAALSRLESFVAGGGAVLVFVGDQTDPDLANRDGYRGGAGFLAAPIGLLVDASSSPVSVDAAGSTHPATVELRRGEYGDWSAARVQRYRRVEPPASAETILAYSDGAPFLVSRSVGRGRSLLCTTTATPEWNELVGAPFFAPLVQEMARWAVGSPAPALTVGERWTCSLGSGFAGQTASVAMPGGEVRTLAPTPTPDGGQTLAFDETAEPGVYPVRFSHGRRTAFAVNVAPAEGDLAALSADAIRTRFAEFRFDRADGSADAVRIVRGVLAGGDLGWPLLWAALGLLVLESLLAWRFGAGRD